MTQFYLFHTCNLIALCRKGSDHISAFLMDSEEGMSSREINQGESVKESNNCNQFAYTLYRDLFH